MPKILKDVEFTVEEEVKRPRGRPRRSTDRTDGYEPSNVGSTPTVGANIIEKIRLVVSSGDFTASQIAKKLSTSQEEWDRVHQLVFAMVASGELVKDYANNSMKLGA